MKQLPVPLEKLLSTCAKKSGKTPDEYLSNLLLAEYKRLFGKHYLLDNNQR
jgi:hypothetical protein